MPVQNKINCPSCGTSIDVSKVLSNQLEEEMTKKFEDEVTLHRKKYTEAMSTIQAKEAEFKTQQENFTELIKNNVNQQLKAERQGLTDQLKKQIMDEQSEQMALLQKEITEKSEQVKELNRTKVEIEQLKREKDEMMEKAEAKLQKHMNESIKIEREKTEKRLKEQFSEEMNGQHEIFKKELLDKAEKVKELNASKLEIEKLKYEKDEVEQVIQVKAQQKLTEQLKVEKEKIQKLATETNELKLREKDEHIEQIKRQLTEAQRKANQGSMQLQGEAQELGIEEWLKVKNPFDSIEEIKKGARGGDCIQTVNTREMLNCGSIYYESKRTKDFQPAWIEKLKADMREKGADIGVLVTSTMPSGVKRMELMSGIWVCSYEEFKGLSSVLRENIIRVSETIQSEECKTDKMSFLYDYLTSNQFKMQIEAIVEGFTQMQTDLDSEKRAMGRIWKQREKQILKVVDNTVNMYGSIRGIAGSAVSDIQALDLPYSNESLESEAS